MRFQILETGEKKSNDNRIVEIDEGSEVESCFICESPPAQSLDGSNKYCSKDHARLHRGHDGEVFPFFVKYKEGIGRFMVAARDIEPGELIFTEEPLAYGPNHSTLPTCLDCMKKADGSYLCGKCNLPACDEMCALGEEHAKECSVLSKLDPKLRIESFEENNSIYWCITTLRVLVLKKSDPPKYRIIQRMMDHVLEHEKAGGYWEIYKTRVADFLMDKFPELDATREEILHIIGVLDVNSVKIHGPPSEDLMTEGYPGHALFPLTSLLSHSCLSNSKTILTVDYGAECRATVKIQQGLEITKQYVSPLEPTNQRRARLKANWFFDCFCERCQDPTENDSYISATRCLKCSGEGTILPSNPLDPECSWLCNNCSFKTNGKAVDKLVEYFVEKLEQSELQGIEALEELLAKAVKLFHPNHYAATLIRIKLNKAYVDLALRVGNPHEIPTEVYMRRKEFLDDIHRVIEIVEPGLSRRRGLSIFEVSTCRLQLGRQLNEINRFHTEDFIRLIEVELDNLKDGLECLKYAREGTREAKVHYKTQGAIYEAEYTMKILRVKLQEEKETEPQSGT